MHTWRYVRGEALHHAADVVSVPRADGSEGLADPDESVLEDLAGLLGGFAFLAGVLAVCGPCRFRGEGAVLDEGDVLRSGLGEVGDDLRVA